MREQVLRRLRRRGVVLGLSGGIDSSVSAALAVAALGAKKVLGVLMPERDSDPDSLRLGRLVADRLGIETVTEDIAPILDAAGCYQRRDEFIRRLVPEFGAGWGCKVVLTHSRRLQHHAARRAVARRRAADGAHAARRLSRRRGRDQHEAADAQAARILSRRPAELRRARHAEPARIRPGLLREERRRRGRHQADRASLQDAGLRARRRISACRRKSARARRPPTPGRSRRARRSFTSPCRIRRWTSASSGWRTGSPPQRSRRAPG